MTNNSIHIIDGIYCKFHCVNEDFLLGDSIDGYNTLSISDVGKIIPYLARDSKIDSSEWEMGLGEITNIDSFIMVKRLRIISSSNHNNIVKFSNLTNPVFCVIPNQYNFNMAFNNIVSKNDNFDIDTIKATYYVDTRDKDIIATLPPASSCGGLIIEIKSIRSSNYVVVQASDNDTIDDSDYLLLSSIKQYTRLISTGQHWIELLNNSSDDGSHGSVGLLAVGPSGSPGGDPLSLQFNAVTGFDGLPAYYVGNNLLLGGDTNNTASHIIPLSNNNDIIFNSLKGSGNFIVNGSSNKNLLFDASGKLGINIPSGLRPASALHINNNSCIDGIRLDNRNSCYPATLTLFHRPSTIPANNSIASIINLAGKNSVNNQVNYVQLKSKILNSTIGYTQGEFIVSVENSGQMTDVMSISRNKFTVSLGVASIDLSPSGTIISGPIALSNLDLDGGIVVFSGLSSDNSPAVTPTPTNTNTPTPTITPSTSPTPTPTPTPTNTAN